MLLEPTEPETMPSAALLEKMGPPLSPLLAISTPCFLAVMNVAAAFGTHPGAKVLDVMSPQSKRVVLPYLQTNAPMAWLSRWRTAMMLLPPIPSLIQPDRTLNKPGALNHASSRSL